MKPNSPFILPTLDIAEARQNKQSAALTLRKYLTEVGFFCISNCGFKREATLEAIKWFFSLPLDHKMKLSTSAFNPNHVNNFRGYLPVHKAIHPKLQKSRDKETFEFGRVEISGLRPEEAVICEPNVWPNFDDCPDTELQHKSCRFQSVMEECFSLFTDLSVFILELICIAFNLEQNEVFTKMFPSNPKKGVNRNDELSVARTFHYLGEGVAGETEALKAHKDRGLITLLSTFNYTGLQVWLNNSWHYVPPSEDQLIANIGELMQNLFGVHSESGEELQATLHRVVDQGEERFSLAYFYEPSYDAVISHNVNGQPIAANVENNLITYGQWRSHSLYQRPENKQIDFKISEKGDNQKEDCIKS